jgi:hypothetical protein
VLVSAKISSPPIRGSMGRVLDELMRYLSSIRIRTQPVFIKTSQ